MTKKTLIVTMKVGVEYDTPSDYKTAKTAIRNLMYKVVYGGGGYKIKMPRVTKITE